MDSGRRNAQWGKKSARGSTGLRGFALIDLLFLAGVLALMGVLLFPVMSFAGRGSEAGTMGSERGAVRP